MIKIILFDIDGVITDGKVIIDNNGNEIKKINYKDIDAIFELKRNKFKIGFISGENTPITNYFKQKFTPDFFYPGCKNKINALKEIIDKENASINEICFVGDSKHDLEAIKYAGLGVCPNDSVEEIKNNAKVVLKTKGGDGIINELIKVIEYYNNSTSDNVFQNSINNHINIFLNLKSDIVFFEKIKKAVEIIIDAYKNNNKLLFCGNGGSAADSQHIATELVSKFYKERKALSAISLTTNTSAITAIGNDYNFEKIFSRQIEAIGKNGDVLFCITTSGKSKNVIEAAKTAGEHGIKIISLIGGNDISPLEEYSDVCIKINSTDTPRIQEAHIFTGHLICEYIENNLFN